MLHIIGLGLYDEKDISVRGLEVVKRCERVVLEGYTSVLLCSKERLEEFYGRSVELADREFVEQKVEGLLEDAQSKEVAFLVVGDPFGATTHTDLQLRALQLGVKVNIIHNASIMNAVAVCGLQLYRFGETISMCFFTDTWRPDSFYEKLHANRKMGLHTLCLLDIRVKEPTVRALCKGIKEYEPPRFMTVNQAIEQLLEVEDSKGEKAYDGDTICIGLARVGCDNQKLVAGPMSKLMDVDFGEPLHSLVITGDLHVVEKEFLETISV